MNQEQYSMEELEKKYGIKNEQSKNTSQSVNQSVNQSNKSGCFSAFVVIICFFAFLSGFSSDSDHKDANSQSSNRSSDCYVTNDGRRCCTVCQKTSYGDIGCGTTCTSS